MVLNNVEALKYETVSVPYTNGSTASKINFPDQPNLRGAKIHAIDLPRVDYDFYGKTNLSFTGVTTIQNIFMTLYYGGREGVFNMPIAELSTSKTAGITYAPSVYNVNGILALNGQVITWTKSYLAFSNGFAPILTDGVFVIGVFYSL